MSQQFQLLPPTITKDQIVKINGRYQNIPPQLVNLVANTDHIWKVTVTPNITRVPKSAGPNTRLTEILCGPCKLVISAEYGGKTGNLFVQNMGRIPTTTPPAEADDIRPIMYYVWGTGSQRFDVIFPKYSSIRVSETVEFD